MSELRTALLCNVWLIIVNVNSAYVAKGSMHTQNKVAELEVLVFAYYRLQRFERT